MGLTSLKHLVGTGCLVAGLALAPQSQAAPVYDTTAVGELIGSRSEPTRIVAGGGWAGTPFSTLSWDIESLGGGLWKYEYTFSADLATPGISHFILDLTDDCVSGNSFADAACVTGANGTLAPGAYDGTNPSNPGMPAAIIGVKFDFGSNFFEFTSNRAPVYGNFYVKGGDDSFAYNAGLANAGSESILDFIARPNSTGGEVPPIPEPSTVLLMGGSLLALGYFRKRRNS